MSSNASTADLAGVDQVRRSLELVWGEAIRPARGPKPSLTVERIVTAAIAVADRDGIDGLSMRRVAAELGVGTMTLYRYVPGKAELVTLMLDRISQPDPADLTATVDDWRRVLDRGARRAYRIYLDHPWVLQVNWSRPILGPNALANMEVFMRAMADLGLTDQEKVSVVMTIDGFVVGQARQRIQYETLTNENGLSDDEFWATQYPYLERAMRSGRYPAMAALSRNAFSLGWDETFDFGLARLLDGVAALVESRRPRS